MSIKMNLGHGERSETIRLAYARLECIVARHPAMTNR